VPAHPTLAARLIDRAQAALPAHPAATVGKAATLAALLATIDTLDREIAGLEGPWRPCWPGPRAPSSPSSAGVGVVAAAGFVAFVGSTDRWADWSKVWRAAGLDPARSQSGPTDARRGISREGSAWGRRAILDLAAAVCQQPGPWRDQLRTRTSKQHQPAKVALAATANAIGRTLFALIASGADYDPAYPTTRAERKAGGRAA
jgi:transposase